MKIEVNATFSPSAREAGRISESLSMTPAISETYFIARVVLFRDQAVQIFPKFFTIGCGFAQEEDWNVNLPLATPARDLYRHIKINKKYDEISEAMCIEAIEMLQAWWLNRP